MNNISFHNNSSLLKQQKIFKWLHQLSFYQIKTIISVKNSASKKLLQKLLYQENQNKQQIIIKGYQEIGPSCIYHRTEFRYKKHKQNKKQAAKNIYDNLTISRIDRCEINVQQLYLESGQLKNDMMTLSEKNMFCFLKYLLAQMRLTRFSLVQEQ